MSNGLKCRIGIGSIHKKGDNKQILLMHCEDLALIEFFKLTASPRTKHLEYTLVTTHITADLDIAYNNYSAILSNSAVSIRPVHIK